MAIKLIAAIGDKRLLGIKKEGKHILPWHIPEDFKHFKHSTNGCAIIMGRTTWESLPNRPLPNRTNIILTRDPDYAAKGGHVFHDLQEAIAFGESVSGETDIWIIGGANIYEQALPYVEEMSLTRVQEELLPPPMENEEHILFPEYEDAFECTEATPYKPSDNRNLPYRFETWKQK